MMRRDVRALRGDAPASDWQDRLVIIWEEDDARPADRERGAEAFHRITRRPLRTSRNYSFVRVDVGDVVYEIYDDGWVFIMTCEGEAVGVVATRD